MRVMFCDDSVQDIDRIKRYILRMTEYAFEYEYVINSHEIIEACKRTEQRPDIYILDIEMPGMDGLAVAKKIRTFDFKALIVFLTGYTKYMPDVFEVVTFDFIPKPITEERLRLLFVKAESYLNMTYQSFSFSYRRSRYSLRFDEIFFLEKKGRQALIHTKDSIYQTNMNLNQIWEKLDEQSFAAVHGSFIVNLKHIKTFSGGQVILSDGKELTVSRSYKKSLTEKHIAFVRGGM